MALEQYEINVVSTAGGSVAGGGTFAYDERVTVVATPASGYEFVRWVEGTAHRSWSASYSFACTGNVSPRVLCAIFAKIVGGANGTVSRSRNVFTATADAGYVFDSWTLSEGARSYVTASVNTLTVNSMSQAGADIVAVANFRKKTAADGYNIYIRWTSQYSVAEGGQEVAREMRLARTLPDSGASLWDFRSDSTTGFFRALVKDPPSRKSYSGYYAANYLPYPVDGAYWEGRNVGAKRSNGDVVKFWELRGRSNGEVLGRLPADNPDTKIADVAALLDSADDGEAPFSNNSAGDYRMAFLSAVFASRHSVAVSTTGDTGADSPTVSADAESAFAGETVTLTAQTDGLETCRFVRWEVDGEAVESSDGVATFVMPDAETVAAAVYELKPLSVVVSAGAGGEASVVDNADGQAFDPDEAKYGKTAKFVAVPAAGSGVSFSGWYADGEFVSANATHLVVLVGDVSLEARFKASFTVGVSAGAGSSGRVLVDGEAATLPATVEREIGAEVAVEAVVDEGVFAGWTKNGNDARLDESDTIAMVPANANAEFVANFAAADETYVVGTSSFPEDGGYIILSGDNVVELGTGSWPSGFAGCQHVYEVTGVLPVHYDVVRTGQLAYKEIEWQSVSPSTDQQGAGMMGSVLPETLPVVATGTIPFSASGVLTAKWANAENYDVSVVSDNPANGIVGIGGTDEGAATFASGERVTVSAVPGNGYLFVGWFENGARVRDAGAVYEFDMPFRDVSLVARFAPDTDAVYEWEGSDENKLMSWTSKVYVQAKPFDPVAARVDAAGYPVDLSVRTYSSPDVDDPLPVRDHELTAANPVAVQSQDGRRLPRMRPERFVRFTVESTHEVDAVVVGTNMTEVN